MHCRTISFKALLFLLRCPPQSVTNNGPEMAAKFADLVVKCLIKLTKSLQSTIQVRMIPLAAGTALNCWVHLQGLFELHLVTAE